MFFKVLNPIINFISIKLSYCFKEIIIYKMELIRLTPDNSHKYIGHEILFKSRGIHIVKKILGISNTCVKIDHPDLNNNLQIVSRKIHVLIE